MATLNNIASVRVDVERSNLSARIVSSSEYVESLKRRYPGFDFPSYKLRQWFAEAPQIFFDCKEADNQMCLHRILGTTGFEAFTIFFVVKEASGTYKLMDASFRNLGTETLEHFISRFHSQLEPMTRLGVQAAGLEYIECIGHSYEEPIK